MPKEAYIRLMAPITPPIIDALFRAIDAKMREKVTRLNLLISSPGGSVFHGMSVYNFLRGVPVEVATYNFGSVDSIGVVIYSAGKIRYCVPHARFLLHGVKMNFSGNAAFDELQIHEHLKSVQVDQSNIAKVIADTTGKFEEAIVKDMHDRTTLNAVQAKSYGLVHEIRTELLPVDADFIPIYESIGQQQGPVRQAHVQVVPAAESTHTRSAFMDITTI